MSSLAIEISKILSDVTSMGTDYNKNRRIEINEYLKTIPPFIAMFNGEKQIEFNSKLGDLINNLPNVNQSNLEKYRGELLGLLAAMVESSPSNL